MSVVYFVSENKIKSFTSITGNVIPDEIYPHMLSFQDIYLQNILGSEFYNELKQQVIDEMTTPNSLTPANKALLDSYISPYVMNGAYWMALPHIYMKTKNKGLVKGTSEEASDSDLGDLKYLRNIAQDVYMSYGERLTRELCVNSSKYPTYETVTTTQNQVPDKSYGAVKGFAIPSARPFTKCNDCREFFTQ